MTDLNIKLVAPPDPRVYEENASTNVLNVKVVENLKQAIKRAKEVNPMGFKTTASSGS